MTIKNKNHHSQNQSPLPYSEPPHQHCGPTILKLHLCGHPDRQDARGSIDTIKINTLFKMR